MKKHVAASVTLCCMLLLLSVPAKAQLEGANSGLVGWWKFDETSGSIAYDSSGKGHNGTLVNGPQRISGKLGSGALSFDGASTYVRIPSSTDFDFNNEFTVSAWVYSTNSSPRVSAVGRAMNNLWHLWTLEQINVPGRFDIEVVSREVYGTPSYRGQGYGLGYGPNTWHHVVGVKTPNPNDVVRIYIDGKVGTDSRVMTDPDPDLSGIDLAIGSRRAITPDNVWFGYIDDVRIYNRALSAAEVADLYSGRTATNSDRGVDFDNDGKADIAVRRADSGTWYMLPSGTPGSYAISSWGLPSDFPVPADYDGDSKTDIAVWRPSTGGWFILPSTSPGTYTSALWGSMEDKPVPADYDGDGKTDIAVWRPSTGVWFMLLSSSPGSYTTRQWGIASDIPITGDYDGDGKTDISVWRRSTGVWYVLLSGTPGSYTTTLWGLSTDKPALGDFDGDGKTDIAVWRPGTGVWYILLSSSPGSYTTRQWGISPDIPITGDYDGDGKTDIAVFRPDQGIWYILPSGSPGTYISRQWGISTDVPLSALTSVLLAMP
jgi:hypothetical protein